MLSTVKKNFAYEWLAKALKQGYTDMGYLRSDPALNSIREERDFQLLLRPYESLEPKNRARLSISVYLRYLLSPIRKFLACGIGRSRCPTVLKFH
mgnify:CR=1 FL=1